MLIEVNKSLVPNDVKNFKHISISGSSKPWTIHDLSGEIYDSVTLVMALRNMRVLNLEVYENILVLLFDAEKECIRYKIYNNVDSSQLDTYN